MSEEKLDAILSELQRLESNIQSINQIQKEMKNQTDEISFIKVAVHEIADAVNRIEHNQDQHERTLNLLSRRSIDQEAEIRSIK